MLPSAYIEKLCVSRVMDFFSLDFFLANSKHLQGGRVSTGRVCYERDYPVHFFVWQRLLGLGDFPLGWKLFGSQKSISMHGQTDFSLQRTCSWRPGGAGLAPTRPHRGGGQGGEGAKTAL